jgi:multiple sugar transport system substrate-binding protein
MGVIAICGSVLLATAACSSGGSASTANKEATSQSEAVKSPAAQDPPAEIKQPVELTIYTDTSANGLGFDATYDGFMDALGKHVQKKYPNISFKLLFRAGAGAVENLVAAKTPFDIRIGAAGMLFNNEDLKIATDMTAAAKKYKFDLTRLQPLSLDWVYTNSNQKLAALPITLDKSVLYYNKDLFDKFGVSYPKDDMTWDETAQLSRRLTRTDSGDSYYGFNSDTAWSNNFLRNQLSQSYLDAKTHQATYGNGVWKQIFDTFLPFYETDRSAKYLLTGAYVDKFVKDQRLAMMKGDTDAYVQFPDTLKWDVVSLPKFKELPNVNEGGGYLYMSVSTLGAHPDEAFLAISALLSDEAQTSLSRNGKYPVLTSQQIQNQFGADVAQLKGKNVKGMLTGTFAPPILLDPYTLAVLGDLNTAFSEAANKTKDVNTALRDAAEVSNKKVAAMLAK